MENTLLYELLAHRYIDNYREKLEKDNTDNMTQNVSDARRTLEKTLDKDRLMLLENFLYELTVKDDYLNIMTGTKILNYGIKIGMNLQKAFDEYNEI